MIASASFIPLVGYDVCDCFVVEHDVGDWFVAECDVLDCYIVECDVSDRFVVEYDVSICIFFSLNVICVTHCDCFVLNMISVTVMVFSRWM